MLLYSISIFVVSVQQSVIDVSRKIRSQSKINGQTTFAVDGSNIVGNAYLLRNMDVVRYAIG